MFFMSLEKDVQANQRALLGNANAENMNNQGPQQMPGVVANQTPTQSNTQNRQSKTVVGVFEKRDQAEAAINQLRQQGFSDNEISIVAKQGDSVGYDTGQYDPFHYTEMANEGNYPLEVKRIHHTNTIANGVLTGGTIGGFGALLAAAGAMTIPVLGPVIAMGPIAAALSGAAAGGVVGGLVDWGVPAERGRAYESKVQSGSILAVIRTNNGQVNSAAEILRQNDAKDVETH
jgi:hypothetical protein